MDSYPGRSHLHFVGFADTTDVNPAIQIWPTLDWRRCPQARIREEGSGHGKEGSE